MYKSIEPSKPPIKITNKIGHYFRFLLLPLGGSTISPWMCDFLKRKARKALKMTVTYFSVLYLISILYYVWLHLFPRKMRIRVEIERIRTQPKNYLTNPRSRFEMIKLQVTWCLTFSLKLKLNFLDFFTGSDPPEKNRSGSKLNQKSDPYPFYLRTGGITLDLPEDKWYHTGST